MLTIYTGILRMIKRYYLFSAIIFDHRRYITYLVQMHKKISASKVLVASPNHYYKLVERYPKMEQIWGLVIEVVGKLLKEKKLCV